MYVGVRQDQARATRPPRVRDADAERDAPGANITSLGDALLWATTTVTTVGYGDYVPVTTTGRLIAVTLMLVGIAVVGSVTAAIASWLIANVQAVEEETH